MDADKLNRLQNKLVAKKFGYWVATSVKGGTDYIYVKGTDTQRTENKRTESQDDKPFSRENLEECLDRLNINNYY
ncbi:MAG: hypothetical protein K6G43_11030 [Lachnospiraceae bacterium]|nr:hypothetical protein [Lachnospiraceae bacterium]